LKIVAKINEIRMTYGKDEEVELKGTALRISAFVVYALKQILFCSKHELK